MSHTSCEHNATTYDCRIVSNDAALNVLEFWNILYQ